MIKRISVIVLACFWALGVSATTNFDAVWKKGNDAYAAKQYDSAAYYFGQIAAQKPENSEVYYNLGNAYYRLNRIGPAILNYERALKQSPDFKPAADNLTLAKARIVNPVTTVKDIFFISWWDNVTRPDRAAIWAIFALLSFSLIFVLAIARRIVPATRVIPVQVQGILAFLCVCFLVPAISSAKKAANPAMAVVMDNDIPLMNGTLKGKPIAYIPEGTTVRINSENNGWVEITLPDGRSGWMHQSAVTGI